MLPISSHRPRHHPPMHMHCKQVHRSSDQRSAQAICPSTPTLAQLTTPQNAQQQGGTMHSYQIKQTSTTTSPYLINWSSTFALPVSSGTGGPAAPDPSHSRRWQAGAAGRDSPSTSTGHLLPDEPTLIFCPPLFPLSQVVPLRLTRVTHDPRDSPRWQAGAAGRDTPEHHSISSLMN